MAVTRNNTAVAQLLIRSGADVNAKERVIILIVMFDVLYNHLHYDDGWYTIVLVCMHYHDVTV